MVSHRSTVAVSVAIIATLLFPYVSSYADTIESMNDSDMKFITSVVSSGDEFLGGPEDYSEEPNPPSKGGISEKILEAKNEKDRKLMDMICKYGRNKSSVSPLCGDWDRFYALKHISQSEGIPFTLQVGINNKESKLGTAYNRSACATRNNWGGTKGSVDANGKKKYGTYPDSQGCYLYKFSSVEEFWISQARSLRIGYFSKGCKTASCIAKYYLTGDRVKWTSDVNQFYISGLEVKLED